MMVPREAGLQIRADVSKSKFAVRVIPSNCFQQRSTPSAIPVSEGLATYELAGPGIDRWLEHLVVRR